MLKTIWVSKDHHQYLIQIESDFVLVWIVSTVHEIYPQNRHLLLFWSGFDSQSPLIDNFVVKMFPSVMDTPAYVEHINFLFL